MTENKPVTITLFHAKWCGHCVDFMPTWEKMKSIANANENIEFNSYEDSSIDKLPEKIRTFEGEDIKTHGFPTIKISFNNEEYLYEGRRTINDIFKYVRDLIKKKMNRTTNRNTNKANNKIAKKILSDDDLAF